MSDHPRALLEISNEIHAVFMPANTTFIVQLRNQGIILTYKLYYLRNTFWKAVAAIDSDSSNGPGQSNFSKTFAILNAIKNNCDTWAEAKIWTSARGWKKLIPSPVGDFEGLKTSEEETTADLVGIARKSEVEMEPEDVSVMLQSHDKILIDEELRLRNEQRKWFTEVESTPGHVTVKIVEMITKNLEYYINLFDKAAVGFERTDSNYERSPTIGRMLSDSIACYRQIIPKRKSQSMWQTLFLSYSKKF